MLDVRRWVAAAVLIASLGLGGLAIADTLNVDGCDDGAGTPYCTIQAAIDAAVDGDEVVVAPGEYFENINLLGKAITVRSTDPTIPGTILATIINGGGSGTVVTCYSGEGPDTVLSGFLITNGSATHGGGMSNTNSSSPTVTNCSFSGNSASLGGGMYNKSNSSPTVSNCRFSGNIGVIRAGGGGMYNSNSSPTVTNCTFSGNTLGDFSAGGGMFNKNSNPTVTNCTFSGNSTGLFGLGGGMFNSNSNPTVTDCTFSGNTAGELEPASGGGMSNTNSSSPTVTTSVFCRNTGLGGLPDQISGGYTDGGGNAISDDHCVPVPPANTESDCERADLNGDGLVDPLDSGFVLARFGCQG